MRILLYNPDNGVTRNFMPHLWMFLLQALTPRGHEVILIDGNTQPMSDDEMRPSLAVDEALVDQLEQGRLHRFAEYATLIDVIPGSGAGGDREHLSPRHGR